MFAAKNELLTRPSGYKISRSLRFRSSASAYLSRTPSSTGSQTTWTWSAWIKRGSLSTATQQILFCGQQATPVKDTFSKMSFTGSDVISIMTRVSAVDQFSLNTAQVFRDPSSWYHIVLSVDTTNATSSSRIKLYVNGSQATLSGTYPSLSYAIPYINVASQSNFIGRYLDVTYEYLDGYLSEVNFIDGQALTPSSFGAFDTNGVWQPAKYTGSYGTNGFYFPFNNTANTQNLMLYSEQFDNANWGKSGSTITANATTAPNGTTTADSLVENTANSGHYAVQTATITASTITTASVYAKANGRYLELDLYSNAYANYIQCLFDLTNGTVSLLGSNSVTNTNYSITFVGNGWYRCVVTATLGTATSANLNCYLSNGSTANYLGNGTSGIYLWGAQLEQQSTAGPYYPTTSAAQSSINCLGADLSGGNISASYNNWTPNNISTTSGTTYDSMIDSPTNYADGGNGRGNYAVLNPLGNPNGPITTYSNGNLDWANAGSAGNAIKMTVISTIGLTSGKWYFEQTPGSNVNQKIGFSNAITVGSARGTNYFTYVNDGTTEKSTGITFSGTPATYTTNNVIGVAIDIDAGTATFYKDGVSQATVSGIPAGTWFAYAEANASASASGGSFNFGQRGFAQTVPSGYSAINTQNLPTPTIAAGNKYFDATTYTGNAGTKPVTNSGSFQPDFVWLKSRSSADQHNLIDAVRGVTNRLRTDGTNADEATPGTFTLDTGGFTTNTTNVSFNGNNYTYVAWQWKGGNGTSNIAVNAYGSTPSITSTVSANTSAGFSVVTWTGNGTTGTVGHGLGVAPSLIIMKRRDTGGTGSNWVVYSASAPLDFTTYPEWLYLNATNAFQTSASSANYPWSQRPSSTLFYMNTGTSEATNVNNATYVAYCFAPVAGYSAFGSYTGNGSTDGAFIYLGFRPRWLLIKRTDTTDNWRLFDSTRAAYNDQSNVLYPNLSNVEDASTGIHDFLSNGFKNRSATANNVSGGTYIYAAFAENPLKFARAR